MLPNPAKGISFGVTAPRQRRTRVTKMRTRPGLIAADMVAVAWTGAWITVAVLVGLDISRLNGLSTTLGLAGQALVTTGHGLKVLSHLPIVGKEVGKIAGNLVATGTHASSTAKGVSGSVHQLSYLLPIVIAVVPVVPTLAVYLPVRIQRIRDMRAVREAIEGASGSDHVERYLARRAVTMLPFHELRKVSVDPWRDLRSGRVRPLAEAELRRLGMDARLELRPPDATATDGR